MIINVQYDSSVTSLSQTMQNEIEAAANAAVAYYEHVFTNHNIFTINIGWGEDDSNPITGVNNYQSSNTWAAGGSMDLSYSQVLSVYENIINKSADQRTAGITLPLSDPTSGGDAKWRVSLVEAQAWGLYAGSGTPSNVFYIGLNSSDSWTFDPSNRAVAGEYDAIGVLEHEISEIMGRGGSLGGGGATNFTKDKDVYTPLDLFRYTAANTRQLTPGPGWFSIDEGATLLKQYNDPTDGDDAGDWLHIGNGGTPGDSYGDATTGVIGAVNNIDLLEDNIIGWNRGPTVDDFNGDGVSDILFWDPANGDVQFANMQGELNPLNTWVDNGTSDTAYAVIGAGDFLGSINSRKVDDVLYRDSSTGATWYYHEDADRIAQGWHQIGGSDTHYSVVGIGDFFGDSTSDAKASTSDIVFRNNSTGDTWIEAMNASVSAGWYQVGGSDTHYAVVGVGDFYGPDGDGTSSILFRNNSTGDVWLEAISSGNFSGWHQIGGSDTHYSVVGIGDFFDNGIDDILYRNNSSGDIWIEAISDGAFAGWHQVGGSNTSYAVVATGDYYGNGTSDILFRDNSSNGDTWYEAISNGAPAVNIFSNSGWHQIGPTNTAYTVVS
jgi:hypothetical protein